MFYKIIENGVIPYLGIGPEIPSNGIEISEEKYNELMNKTAPANTLETAYYLSAETETYIGRETTRQEKVDWYTSEVLSGTIALEDVPEEYRVEVEAELPKPTYTLDEAADLLMEEVANEL